MSQALANVQYKPTEMTTERLGAVMVKSGFFQDARDEAQAIVKILAGHELGIGPIASMQGIYIVKGRFTLAANLIAAIIQRSNKYRYRVTRLDNDACSMTFYVGGNEIGESTFTMEDAKTAGIVSDTYRKFPRNMLFSRALTNGARWFCPEVFAGGPVYTPDELGADVDDDGRMVEVVEHSRVAPTRDREVDDKPADDWTQCAICETPQQCYNDGEAFVCRDNQACIERLAEKPAAAPKRKAPTRDELTDRYAELVNEATGRGIPLDADKWGIGQDDTLEQIAEKGKRLKYLIYGDEKPKRAA